MKIVFASDSFKGSLSNHKINTLLEESLRKNIPDAQYEIFLMADGGEGTMDAIVSYCHGKKISLTVHDPLFKNIKAEYGILNDGSAIIETASASGLPLVKESERNPLLTSTYGTGELIRDALTKGCRKIYITLGGSATNDGGTGALSVLGIRFLNGSKEVLKGTGENLRYIETIDFKDLMPEVKETEFILLSDVKNPLCGKDGAVYTFAPQKGADEEMMKELEEGMQHYRKLMIQYFGIDADMIKGAGAAGGCGAGFAVFLHAKIQSGVETVLDLEHFDEAIRYADYVITGEGCTDWQSAYGKVLQGVGEHCEKYHVPCIAISGSLGKGYEEIKHHGITELYETSLKDKPLAWNMAHAEELYSNSADKVFSEISQKYK
ncbi:MAG: glycerate kinase [Erysipelotrichaceae bacterium]|nr:glycerate kinase [Erysipelotrichaceae bacterium]